MKVPVQAIPATIPPIYIHNVMKQRMKVEALATRLCQEEELVFRANDEVYQ